MSVLTNESLLFHLFSFLPKGEMQTCSGVSKSIHQVVQKMPLKLRIEDRGKKLLWIFRPSWKLDKDGQSDRNEMVYPFYKIGSIPPQVRNRVTELTLVMRLVKERLDDYQLESMVDILKDFTNLEYLRVMSTLGPGDAFCHLFKHKNYFPHLRTVFISGYCLDALGADFFGLGDVERSEAEEIAKKYHVITRGSTLLDLVQAAPNIEYLEVCSHAGGSKLEHLLPLAKSLRAIRFCSVSPPIIGDIDEFVKHMPLLQSWDFRASMYLWNRNEEECRAKNADALSKLEAPVWLYHHWYIDCTNWEYSLAHVYFFKCYVSWFCTLQDEDKNRSDLPSLLSIAKAFSLDQMTKGGMGLENIGSRLVKKNVEDGFKSFRRYFLRRKITRNDKPPPLCWGRMLYPLLKHKLLKMQERANRKNFAIYEQGIGVETICISSPHYFYKRVIELLQE